jgi:hypothetical protein
MTVIKKPQSTPNVAQKKEAKKAIIQSVREPSVINEMGDTDFGDLGPAKDGQIVSYDSTTNKFVLITADELLGVSVEDNDIPDEFVTTLESELNLGQIQLENLDGGVF